MSRFLPLGRLPCLIGLVLLPSLGCHTAVLDMRNIEEPVMLNALPYANGDWTVTEVGPIRADVRTETDDLNIGDHTYTARTRTNEAEVKVYETIGAYDRRVVSGASITLTGTGLNLLFYMTGGIQIDLTGQVVDLDARSDEPSDEALLSEAVR